MLELSTEATRLAGILVLAAVTVESGGLLLVRIAAGGIPKTEFQKSFARAGHGHAGMFITLGLVTVLLTDATSLDGFAAWLARSGVPLAAILMPAGFFAASAGPGRTSPNRAIVVLWLGAASLAAGLVTLGIGLLSA